MTQRLSIAARFAALAATFAVGVGARAYVPVTTKDGTPVTWTHRCVEVWTHTDLVSELTADEVYSALEQSLAEWSGVDCSWIEGVARGFTCFDHVGLASWPGPQNELLTRDTEGTWLHPQRVVALTSLSYDPRDGEINDADVELNGEDYRFAIDGTLTSYDLQQTLTHELGHVFGLDHTPVAAATMYALSYAGEISKRTLAPDDIEGICATHPMASAPATGGCEELAPAPVSEPWCPPRPEQDCAAGGGLAGWWLALAALLVWRRRVRGPGRRRSLPTTAGRRPWA